MYDDFAILDDDTGAASNEYKKIMGGKILSVKSQQTEDQTEVLQKVEYLSSLLQKLKNDTKNADTKIVLEKTEQNLQLQQQNLLQLFGGLTMALGEKQPETVMFCNNLKLAIQTSGEIVKSLIQIKDAETTAGEIRPQYTDIILAFLDVNNNLVSLFGDCRYRVFRQKRLF